MQDSWLSARPDDIKGYADKNDMKNFYSSLKEVYGPTSAGSAPLLCADGTKLISEKKKILEWWTEHFDDVLNRPSSIDDKAIEWLSQVPVNESLDVTPVPGEVQIAIHQLSGGKAPGFDSIPVEIYKESGSALTAKLLTLIHGWKNNYSRTSRTPPSSIFTNGKGTNRHAIITAESPYFQFQARSQAECFWIASTNILNRDSYWRINTASVRNVGLLTWCLQEEKCQEQNTDHYSTYIDLTMVIKDGLGRIMARYGCPERFITIIW